MVAAPVQIYALTSSSFAVGLLGLVQIVPLIVGSLIGGAFADAHDRRRLLLIAQLPLMLTSAGLALNAMSGSPRLWLIYVLSGLAAAFSGLDSPTRAAATPTLVDRARLPSALALMQLVMQTGLVIGPAIAGVLIAAFSESAAYWLDVVSFSAAIIALLMMAPMVPEGGGTKASRSSILEGLHFLKGRRAVQGTFVIDINAMVFGMPRALFPAIGQTVFGGTAATVGLLYAAPGFGAFVGVIFSGWLRNIDKSGRGVLYAVLAWGAAIALFGLVPWLVLALAFLAIAGAADMVSAVFRNSVLQLSVPDRLRGRLSSIHIAVVTGGPRLGDLESGAVAALTNPTFAVVSGGLACMAGVGIIAKLLPELGRWRLSDHTSTPADD
jgi:MFS family permease